MPMVYTVGELSTAQSRHIENAPVVMISQHEKLKRRRPPTWRRWRRGLTLGLISDHDMLRIEVQWVFEKRCAAPNRLSARCSKAVPVQLLVYQGRVFIGTDGDQPRNLAKSVTVE